MTLPPTCDACCDGEHRFCLALPLPFAPEALTAPCGCLCRLADVSCPDDLSSQTGGAA